MQAQAERWERLVAGDPEEASLAEGALLIAAQEYEQLDIDAYLGRIDEMAAALRQRLRRDIPPTEALMALNRYLFEELGFSGNAGDYYDPRNSFLNDVIDRRLGIPITLAVLYIEVGRRIGLPLEGVSFPAHFLVKCELREGTIVIDPFARGASLGVDDLRERLKTFAKAEDPDPALLARLLTAATPREIWARMLRNLRAIYLSKGETLKALAASDRVLTLLPDAAEDYRERAELYAASECFRAAVADYREYLKLRPDAHDSRAVAERIAELEPVAARLN